jgi:hypothetical protein
MPERKVILLILLLSVIIIGFFPKRKQTQSKCGKKDSVLELFTSSNNTSAKEPVDNAADPMHKVIEAAVIAPVSSAPITAKKPDPNVDTIESHLADKLPCSKSCCGAQWPVPHMQGIYDASAPACTKDLVPSDMSCGNGDDGTGCVCMNSGTSDFIGSRGGNA